MLDKLPQDVLHYMALTRTELSTADLVAVATARIVFARSSHALIAENKAVCQELDRPPGASGSALAVPVATTLSSSSNPVFRQLFLAAADNVPEAKALVEELVKASWIFDVYHAPQQLAMPFKVFGGAMAVLVGAPQLAVELIEASDEAGRSSCLLAGCDSGTTVVVRELLHHVPASGGYKTAIYADALVLAAGCGQVELVRLLLADAHCEPTATGSRALCAAIKGGHANVVRAFLLDGRIDPGADDNAAIVEASLSGMLEIVTVLLADSRVDPGASNNRSMCKAAGLGHSHIVAVFLAHAAVDPTAGGLEALHAAVAGGHAAVVSLFLADNRIDAANCSSLLTLAVARNHDAIIKLLLTAGCRVPRMPTPGPVSTST
ncbi:uncharacterized protein AMSG_05941 [Thecamonas trahens ATCC 50062]|uniref:Ankyrin repeat protein n=1 Tax=Thecamonas trahens ATCC 50062 TaxID=461836 RepID=A0A0L0DBS5_THETB|nr:hypothetical protein AMSG_05941 [Thecamonas trahens ATCC 50062]KNC49680.1 hypothetical protein AMSG_05941 [Thecamonas trahens ATCC 50062]|eukprot:XP_013757476.1 hypothetical protein AMSG_05941 [Thecamonas trahens ATCC 50062]